MLMAAVLSRCLRADHRRENALVCRRLRYAAHAGAGGPGNAAALKPPYRRRPDAFPLRLSKHAKGRSWGAREIARHRQMRGCVWKSAGFSACACSGCCCQRPSNSRSFRHLAGVHSDRGRPGSACRWTARCCRFPTAERSEAWSFAAAGSRDVQRSDGRSERPAAPWNLTVRRFTKIPPRSPSE